MRLLVEKPESVRVSPLQCGLCPQPPQQFTLRPEGMGSWQLILGIKGEGRLIRPGGDLALPPGQMLLFSPEAPQHYGNATSRIWYHLAFIFKVGPNWQRWLNWPEIAPGVGAMFPKREAGVIRRTLWQANRAARGTHLFGKELAMDYLHQALIHCQNDLLAMEETKVDPRLTKLIEEMGKNLRKSHISVAAMASQAGMSPSQLLRAFERQFGVPPARYFHKLRMEHAAELLRTTTVRVREVAYAVGYDDPLYFSNRFRAATGGLSPRQYRKHVLIKPY